MDGSVLLIVVLVGVAVWLYVRNGQLAKARSTLTAEKSTLERRVGDAERARRVTTERVATLSTQNESLVRDDAALAKYRPLVDVERALQRTRDETAPEVARTQSGSMTSAERTRRFRLTWPAHPIWYDDFQAGVIPTLVALMPHRLTDAQRRVPCATLTLRPLPIASRARNDEPQRIISRLTAGVAVETFFQGVFAQRSAPQFAGQHVKAHGVTSRSRRSAVASRTGRVRLCSLLLLFTLHVLTVGESLKACPRC